MPVNHFQFSPTFFFADEVLPCFVSAVTIVKTVVFKTLNNWVVEDTDAPAERAPMICPFWTSDNHPFYPRLVLRLLNTTYTRDA